VEWPAIPEGSWCWRSKSHERVTDKDSTTRRRNRIAGGLCMFHRSELRTGQSYGRRRRQADPYGKTCQRPRPDTHGGYCQLSARWGIAQAPSCRKRLRLRAVGCGPIREFATGPVKVYKAGESFFEPPGSTHAGSTWSRATTARGRAGRRPESRSRVANSSAVPRTVRTRV
jgi:hypothetical protein